jgi:WD40 repeat protein
MKRPIPVLLLFILLAVSACGPTPTRAPSATPTPPATATLGAPRPTNTPPPTATPQTTRVLGDGAILLDRLDTQAVSVAWSRDGRYLYVGTETRGLLTYHVDTRARLTMSGEGHIEALALSPDGLLLAAGIATDGSIRILETGIGEVIAILHPTHASAIKSLQFSPDNRLLASSGDDGKVFVWDVATGDKLHDLVADGGPAWGMAFSPDGSLLVAGTVRGHEMRVWETATWTLRNTFLADQAVDLAFSADGEHILTAGGGQNEANLWNVNTGERRFNLGGATGWVWAVDFTPDGRLAATGGNNEVITLWDAGTGLPVREYYTGRHFTQALAFSPDGARLASVSHEVWVWPAP